MNGHRQFEPSGPKSAKTGSSEYKKIRQLKAETGQYRSAGTDRQSRTMPKPEDRLRTECRLPEINRGIDHALTTYSKWCLAIERLFAVFMQVRALGHWRVWSREMPNKQNRRGKKS